MTKKAYYFYALIPLELRHIGEPLLIGLGGMELTVEQVLCDVLRILYPTCTAVVAVFNGGLNPSGPADTQNALVIHMNVFVVPEIVIDAPVALVRAVHVDLLNLFSQLRVFCGPETQLAGRPFVVCRARNM